MEQKIIICDQLKTDAALAKIEAELGGVPDVIITIEGKTGTGKSAIAGMTMNTIKKNAFSTGYFKNASRILINVEQT